MDAYLISYDIPDNKRRTKVANALEDYGQRVQYSVFEVWLDPNTKRKLTQRLKRVINEEEDSVRFYWLCAQCQRRVTVLGNGTPPEISISFAT